MMMFANVLVILTGLFFSFILPIFISVEQYGYFKLFGFYLGLVGIAHLGFNDGILLKYGHFNYEELPKGKFRTFFWFLFGFQVIISLVLLIVIIIFNSSDNRKIIMVFTIINILITNLTTFFAYICQITKNFKRFSINTTLYNSLSILGIFIFISLKEQSYIPYIIVQTIANTIILCKYIYEMRELVFGKQLLDKLVKKEIIDIFKIGFPLLVGNFMAMLIIGVDRIFIDAKFSITEFSYYSFAVSLLGLVFTFIIAISNYLYPYLARKKNEIDNNLYTRFSFLCILISSYSLVSFFILKYIIIEYLPNYKQSLSLAMIIYPTIIFRTNINVVGVNLYKVLSDVKSFNKNNIFSFFITLLVNVLITIVSPTLINYAIGTIICFYLWHLYTEYYFYKKLNVNSIKNNFLIILVVILFFFTNMLSIFLGTFLYISILTIIVVFFFKDNLKIIKVEYFNNRRVS